MTLWEYGALTHGWAERNKTGGAKDDGAPAPTEEDWAMLREKVARATRKPDHGDNR